jgi:hypothetical protein
MAPPAGEPPKGGGQELPTSTPRERRSSSVSKSAPPQLKKGPLRFHLRQRRAPVSITGEFVS